MSLKDLTVLLWKECSSQQTAQAAESRFFQLAINVPRTAKMRRQCGDTLYTIKFKHRGSWSIWGMGNLQGCQVWPCLPQIYHLGREKKKKKKERKGQYLGFLVIPSLQSIDVCNLWREGERTWKEKVIWYFPHSLRTVSSRKLPTQTHYRTIEPDN